MLRMYCDVLESANRYAFVPFETLWHTIGHCFKCMYTIWKARLKFGLAERASVKKSRANFKCARFKTCLVAREKVGHRVGYFTVMSPTSALMRGSLQNSIFIFEKHPWTMVVETI